jgi:hypothetical protein
MGNTRGDRICSKAERKGEERPSRKPELGETQRNGEDDKTMPQSPGSTDCVCVCVQHSVCVAQCVCREHSVWCVYVCGEHCVCVEGRCTTWGMGS